MQVGDLVRVTSVDGWPMGMILQIRDHTCGYRIKHYSVKIFDSRWQSKPHDFLQHQMEVISESR